jgi:hypothetical protein
MLRLELIMNNLYQKRALYIFGALAFFMLASCAGITLKTIPPPSPTAKLRVYVLPLTVQGKWGTTYEEYVDKTISRVEEFLDKTGIYEVVTKSDVRAVLGDETPSKWQMERNGWAFARHVGKALHADYVMIIERGKERSALGGSDVLFTNRIINTETGKIFEAWSQTDRIDRSEHDKMIMALKASYREIFSSAKLDMLETAVKKSESRMSQDKNVVPVQQPADVPAKAKPKPQVAASEIKKADPKPQAAVPAEIKKPEPVLQHKADAVTSKPADVKTGSEKKQQTSIPELPEKRGLKAADKPPVAQKDDILSGGIRLVIYDLEAPDNVKTVALILTEVLREELFRLKRFILVNRETLNQLLSEMALQQSGLIDEQLAVKAGKGLAANQVVTGRLGMLGKTYILQAKRIDVETFATLNFASTKFIQGQEEDVLSRLPELARSLAGLE